MYEQKVPHHGKTDETLRISRNNTDPQTFTFLIEDFLCLIPVCYSNPNLTWLKTFNIIKLF